MDRFGASIERADDLPVELRALVRRSVALLGEVIRRELGAAGYARVEKIRREMAEIREKTSLAPIAR